MKRYKELITSSEKNWTSIPDGIKCPSLQDKMGATAEQIRRAIEIVGFDRDKVEQYILETRAQR